MLLPLSYVDFQVIGKYWSFLNNNKLLMTFVVTMPRLFVNQELIEACRAYAISMPVK